MPRYVDSVDKIVGTYFACVTKEPFDYKHRTYHPKPLRVSSGIVRGFTCPAGCGGCCPKFSLDFLPSEKRRLKPPGVTKRLIAFNDREVEIWSDLQDDHDNHHCRNLRRSDARCGIHGRHPFSCDFELLRFSIGRDRDDLTQRLFGRGWQFLRADMKTRGAMCSMTPPTPETRAEVVRKLRRLKEWTDHFGIRTHLDDIINWVPHAVDGIALELPGQPGLIFNTLDFLT